MLFFRLVFLGLLLASGVCFVLFIGSNNPRYRRWGMKLLQWAILAGLGFFSVLILMRIL